MAQVQAQCISAQGDGPHDVHLGDLFFQMTAVRACPQSSDVQEHDSEPRISHPWGHGRGLL